MATICTLAEAVRDHLHDGDVVAMEGFTHLIPVAAGHEVVRQRRRDLTLIRMTPDIVYDQMLGMGCANPLEIEEYSHAGMSNAYVAGACNLPFAVLRGYIGSDIPKYNPRIKRITCPYTGEELATVPSIRPDVAVIHAQKADRKGNVLIWGILGVQKEAVLAAKRAIVTVEEIVDDLRAPPNACVLPHWTVNAVCAVPGGSWPSYAEGYYERDNAFYIAWDEVSRDRERYREWMDRHVLETRDWAEFRRVLGESMRAQEPKEKTGAK